MPDSSFSDKRQLCRRKTDKVPQSFFTGELSWDKEATHTEDVGTFFSVQLPGQLAAEDPGIPGQKLLLCSHRITPYVWDSDFSWKAIT